MNYSIKQVSAEVNLAAHTLRYYENEGLMPNVKRDINGNRVFDDHNVEWLRFVVCLRNTGMPIKEMKHFVSLMLEGDHTVPNRIEILYEHKDYIQSNIEKLDVYMDNVINKIAYYESLACDERK